MGIMALSARNLKKFKKIDDPREVLLLQILQIPLSPNITKLFHKLTAAVQY